MVKQTGISDNIISLPKGAGGLEAIENNFEVDKQKGTFHFSQPIDIPEGRNGLTPKLGLSYSSAHGNGVFGLGWASGLSMFMRDTKHGVPLYQDADQITWTSAEKLLLMDDQLIKGERQRIYRPQPDQSYAQIKRITNTINDYWIVTLPNGIKQYYGQTRESRVFDSAQPQQVFQWYLNQVEDTYGNTLLYEYSRDRGVGIQQRQTEQSHHYHQLYLTHIRYVEYEDDTKKDYLYHILLDYGQYADQVPNASLLAEDQVIATTQIQENIEPPNQHWAYRPDPFSNYKAGFEIRTARRCERILIAIKEKGQQDLTVTQAYLLHYAQTEPTGNQVSQLQSIQLVGIRKNEKPEILPPTEFTYGIFDPTQAKFEKIQFDQNALPATAIHDANTNLIDLFGNGLPDLLHATEHSYRYWKNKGELQFEIPSQMPQHPPVALAYPGTQFGDMQGNGSVDLLTSHPSGQGFYETRFDASWKQFKPFANSLSVNLADPQLKLFDTTGDGLVDMVLTIPERFLIYRNQGKFGFQAEPIVVPRLHDLDQFPDVSFADLNQQVRLADMTGDGLQDIVLLHGSSVDYWPNMGHGKFGARIQMFFVPGLTGVIDYQRLHLVDLDGDGCADLVYLGTDTITIWCNQQGNQFATAFTIHGTPFLAPNAIQFADLKGHGSLGILYFYPLSDTIKYEFLDLMGQQKAYLLTQVENNRGAKTFIQYHSSTYFYQQANAKGQPWQTHLPFPVQCVSRITTIDVFSKGKVVMEYDYHHGYWDGIEREFRGFGYVIQRDTQFFADYHSPLMGEDFLQVEKSAFSHPVEMHVWFHLGAISHTKEDIPKEIDYTDEFWPGDPQRMQSIAHRQNFPKAKTFGEKREQLNALKGQILRTEIYALDGSTHAHKPYVVTETIYRITSVTGIHSIYQYGSRKTNWERGDEPQTQYSFVVEFDKRYGRTLQSISVAVPKKKDRYEWNTTYQNQEAYLITAQEIDYAKTNDPNIYIIDRIATTTTYEIHEQRTTLADMIRAIKMDTAKSTVLSYTINYYDNHAEPFQGLPLGQLGKTGELVKTEQLVFNLAQLKSFCRSGDTVLPLAEYPNYFKIPNQTQQWPDEPPEEFLQKLPPLAGYHYKNQGPANLQGYYQITTRQQFNSKGMMLAEKNALDQQTSIEYDTYNLFPVKVTGPIDLAVTLQHDYLIGEIHQVTDANHNVTEFSFTPLGLLRTIAQLGKNNSSSSLANKGDTLEKPSITYIYNHLAYMHSKHTQQPQPIEVKTFTRKKHYYHHKNPRALDQDEIKNYPGHFIEEVTFQDGFGRLLQVRKRIDATIYYGEGRHRDGDPRFLTSNLSDVVQHEEPIDATLKRDDHEVPLSQLAYAFVGGLKRYNNKGQIVVNYGGYYDKSKQDYDCMAYHTSSNIENYLVKTTHHFDVMNRETMVIHDDFSKTLIIFGRVKKVTDPTTNPEDLANIIPTPWYQTTFDQNDNAGRTHPGKRVAHHAHHYNTPIEIELDMLGRNIKETKYLRKPKDEKIQPLITGFKYDIKNNVLNIVDADGRIAFRYLYDNLNQEWRTENIDAGVTHVILNALGNIIETHNARNAVIFSLFDKANRLNKLWAKNKKNEKLTLRQIMLYGDDSSNQILSSEEKRKHNLNGELYQLYEESGRTTVDHFDFKGNPLKEIQEMIHPLHYIKNPDFVVDWSHDRHDIANSLLDSHTLYVTQSSYDVINNPLTVKVSDNINLGQDHQISYKYNYSHGIVSQIKLNDKNILENVTFSAKGYPVLFVYSNHTKKYFAYDDETLLLSRLFAVKSVEDLDPMILQNTSYHHDLVDNIVEVVEQRDKVGIPNSLEGLNQLTREFSYDSLYRLVAATGREIKPNLQLEDWQQFVRSNNLDNIQAYQHTYNLDDVDNLIKKTELTSNQHKFFTPKRHNPLSGRNANNQLEIVKQTGETDRQYQYDMAGNMTQEKLHRQFSWDFTNQMIQFSDEKTIANYVYGIDGQRTQKIVRSKISQAGASKAEITVYINTRFEHRYDIKLDDQNNELSREQLYNRIHIKNGIHHIAITTITPTSTTRLFCLTDHLGNIIRGLDEQGQSQFETEYYPYGSISLGGNEDYPYIFTGKERDEESGLYYYGKRYYAPYLGRWISVDPAGANEGVNGYQFCGNNPISCIDETGEQRKNYKIADPGLWNMLPFVGPGWKTLYHLERGNFGRATLWGVMTVADAFLVYRVVSIPSAMAKIGSLASTKVLKESWKTAINAAKLAKDSLWKKLPGEPVELLMLGDWFVKRVAPGATGLKAKMARASLEAQYRVLKTLSKAKNLTPEFFYHNGMIFTKNAGNAMGWKDLANPIFWKSLGRGSYQLGTLIHDIRLRNVGASGLIFDPALDLFKGAAFHFLYLLVPRGTILLGDVWYEARILKQQADEEIKKLDKQSKNQSQKNPKPR